MQASDVNSQKPRGRRRSLSQGNASDLVGLPSAPVLVGESSYSKIRSLLRPRAKTPIILEGIHDIDKNLHFREGEYNSGLGEAFKAKNITRNVFCTDMANFAQIEILTRCAVRDHYAKQYKFDTRAIITPADYAWHLDAKLLADFFMECIKLRVDLRVQRNLEQIDEILKNPYFEKIALLIKPNKTSEELEQIFAQQAKPGAVFEALEPLYKRLHAEQTRLGPTIEIPEKLQALELAEKAHHAKWVVDVAAFKSKLPGVKGLVLSKFFKDNELKVSDFVFTDDKQEEVEAVIIESARWPNARVTGIVTPADLKNCTKKYYKIKLESCFSHPSSAQHSSDEDASSQRNSGSVTPPADPLKNKARSTGDSPEEKQSSLSLRSSQTFGK